MCQRLKDFKPDAILAMERGGGLVAAVVKARDGALGEKVVSLDRAPDSPTTALKTAAKAAGYIGVMTERSEQGQRRFAVVDFEMGGYTAGGFHLEAQKFLESHPGAEIQTFWIQETAGWETTSEGNRRSSDSRTSRAPTRAASPLTSSPCTGPWARMST